MNTTLSRDRQVEIGIIRDLAVAARRMAEMMPTHADSAATERVATWLLDEADRRETGRG